MQHTVAHIQGEHHGAKEEKCVYLVHVDGDGDDNVKQVPECQAANQDVWPVPHTLVLVYDPQQRWVADNPNHKNKAGHDGVHVLEGVRDLCGLDAHGGVGAPRSAGLRRREQGRGVALNGLWRGRVILGVAGDPRGADLRDYQETQQSAETSHPRKMLVRSEVQ